LVTFSAKYTLSLVRITVPVLGRRTIIIWLPGVWPTQRFTTTLLSAKRSKSPLSWIMGYLFGII